MIDNGKCYDCGADITFIRHENGFLPYNTETMKDEHPQLHFETCRKPKEKPLTVEQRTRPGYL